MFKSQAADIANIGELLFCKHTVVDYILLLSDVNFPPWQAELALFL